MTNRKPRFFLINVLKPSDYVDCHIRGSMNISLDKLHDWAQDIEKDALIVLYCASYACLASHHAWHKLNELGFTNVKTYTGGMNEWYHEGLPVDGLCTHSYLKDTIDAQEAPQKSEVHTITSEELKQLMAEHGLQ